MSRPADRGTGRVPSRRAPLAVGPRPAVRRTEQWVRDCADDGRVEGLPMSTVQHTLAVVAVSDMDQAAEWYERLLGCPPTNRPMPSLVEWQVTSGGWLQVTADKHRAGHSQ